LSKGSWKTRSKFRFIQAIKKRKMVNAKKPITQYEYSKCESTKYDERTKADKMQTRTVIADGAVNRSFIGQ